MSDWQRVEQKFSALATATDKRISSEYHMLDTFHEIKPINRCQFGPRPL